MAEDERIVRMEELRNSFSVSDTFPFMGGYINGYFMPVELLNFIEKYPDQWHKATETSAWISDRLEIAARCNKLFAEQHVEEAHRKAYWEHLVEVTGIPTYQEYCNQWH